MPLRFVQGPPGTGKSYYAVRVLAAAVQAGKPVATNVELAPDWAERVAARNPLRRLSRRRVAARAAELRRLVLVSEDLGELFSARYGACAKCRRRGRGDCNHESRAVMILDEAHNWMNARAWTQKDRERIVRFFSQHRKIGLDVFLIAQDAEMVDRQVRFLFETLITLRNAKSFRVLGVRILPVNFFLALWTWHAAPTVVVKRQSYFLGWERHLYNTMATSHGLEEDVDQVIRLPRPAT